MRLPIIIPLQVALLWLFCTACQQKQQIESLPEAAADWPVYRGSATTNQHSLLAQITPWNVGQLQQARVYHTGDASERTLASASLTEGATGGWQ